MSTANDQKKSNAKIRNVWKDGGVTNPNRKGNSSGGSSSSSSLLKIFVGENPTLNGIIVTAFKYIIAIVVVVIAYILFNQTKVGIQDLTNANQQQLKKAIFGDIPYMFYCQRETPSADKPSIPAIFTDLNTLKGGKVGFGVLNCSQVLPSGKTIWERFQLKKEYKPTIWGNAPWGKPRQAGPVHLKDVQALSKFVDDSFTAKATSITSPDKLTKYCGFDKKKKSNDDDEQKEEKTCVAILKGARYNPKIHTELEQKLVTTFPQTRFASIDATKARFTFENIDDLPAENFAIKVYALRDGDHFLNMVNPVTYDYLTTFVSQAIASSTEEYENEKVLLQKLSTFRKKKADAEKKSKQSKQKATNSGKNKAESGKNTAETKKPASQAANEEEEIVEDLDGEDVDDAEDEEEDLDDNTQTNNDASSRPPGIPTAEQFAQMKAEQLRRERMKREQMEQQQRDYLFEEGDDGTVEEAQPNEEEDEHIIEL